MGESASQVTPAAKVASDAALPDPVSLQILIKALAAAAAAVATAPLGAEFAAASAVVATIVADAVKELAKRRRWGRKRLAALTGLLLMFSAVDKSFAALMPRRRRTPRAATKRRAASHWPRALATSAAAVGIAVIAFTAPEAGFGRSFTTDSRSFTFFPGHPNPPPPVPTNFKPPLNVEPPSIAGNAVVGASLTGSVGSWRGKPAPTLELQWLRCNTAGANCKAIAGADGTTLALGDRLAGATIVFKVIARNDSGTARSRSAATAPIAAITPMEKKPANRKPPTISGLARVGEALTGNVGQWSGQPAPTLELQWLRCDAAAANCAAIAGVNGTTLVLGDDLAGATIVLEVIARNNRGKATSRSPATAPIAVAGTTTTVVTTTSTGGTTTSTGGTTTTKEEAPANVERPAISGLARVGETLTGSEGRWSGEPTPTLELQWLRCDAAGAGCSAIAAATSVRYAPSRSDLGMALVLEVSAKNAAGGRTAKSDPSTPVEAAPQNLEPPSLDGKTTVGETLTAKPGNWSAFPSATYAYQWLRCTTGGDGCTAVAGATTATLTLVARDAGFTFRVEVTASNALGDEPARSDPSAVVSRAPIAPFNRRPPTVTYVTGSTLPRYVASPGSWGGAPTPTLTYQWQDCGGRVCVDISAATGSSYVPRRGQPGCEIRVVVTARNEAGSSSATSTIYSCPG